MRNPLRRVQVGLAALALVFVAGTVGYLVLGFGLLDAFYETVVTVSTVGYGFPHALSAAGKIFTIALILVGAATALYTFTVTLELLIDGHMRDLFRRRRMQREIDAMEGHVVICGWGRVGREVARYLDRAGQRIVVVDRDAERLSSVVHPTVSGDVTDDETLLRAGIERAGTLIAALDTDADNLFLTVAGRSFQPSIHVIARARSDTSEAKLLRVGRGQGGQPATARRGPDGRIRDPAPCGGLPRPRDARRFPRVPPRGAERRPRVTAARHDTPLERGPRTHRRPGDRHPPRDGTFTTNPSPETAVNAGDVLIGVGTSAQLGALQEFASRP